MMSYIVFYVKNKRIGSVPKTKQNLSEAHDRMVLNLIQRDITGTLHFSVLGIRKQVKR